MPIASHARKIVAASRTVLLEFISGIEDVGEYRLDDGDVRPIPLAATIRTRLRELSAERHRFGFRRLHVLLASEGIQMNQKKLRRRNGHKRALGTGLPMTLPQGKNQHWSLDFLSDALIDGRHCRILAMVDDFTHECLTLVAGTSLSGLRVAPGQPLSVCPLRGVDGEEVGA